MLRVHRQVLLQVLKATWDQPCIQGSGVSVINMPPPTMTQKLNINLLIFIQQTLYDAE